MDRVTTRLLRAEHRVPCRLRVLSGPRAGEEIELPPAGLLIGAAESCGLVLEDRAVSARHATVRASEGGFEVRDLDSRNGTWLDGARLTRAVVPIGSSLLVGGTLLQLLPAEEHFALPPSTEPSFGGLVGSSEVMRVAFTALQRASASNVPVLLLGESGTGKEVAARALHQRSARAGGPFIVFDCGAASETLVESELFGHVKGAFTGALEARTGAFELASGGTLFLDEIGDLPLSLQPKLLRLLESGEIRPLGAKHYKRHDVRIVAATHRDLFEEVQSGAFRADLYYRLAVVEVVLPPLRARREDIPPLLRHFLREHGRTDEVTDPAVLERLLTYAWPGNVRELRNVVGRAVALAPPGATADELPFLLRASSAPEKAPSFTADRPFHEAKEALIGRFEREYLADLLRRHPRNLSAAARAAGVERKYLYRLLSKAGLMPAGTRTDEE